MFNLIQDQYLKHIEIHLAVKQEIEASNLFGRKSELVHKSEVRPLKLLFLPGSHAGNLLIISNIIFL